MPRTVIDPGPFRFKDIHGPRRSFEELSEIARLLKLRGHRPVQCRFSLHRVPVRDLIESLIVEAHLDRGLRESGAFDYDAWRGAGAPEAPLRRLFTAIGDARRQESPRFMPRLVELERLYADGAPVEPLVGEDRDFALSTGEPALIVLDGRHRVFAAARARIERLPVFVLM